MKWLLPLVILGCSTEELPCLAIDCESSDTASTLGAPSFERIAWGCCTAEYDASCPESGAFWYDVMLEGGTDSLVLQCSQTDGAGEALYQEFHPIPMVIEDAEAGWSNHFLELPLLDSSDCPDLADCPELYEPGQSSLYSCSEQLLGQMNWTLSLSPEEDLAADNCGSWGAELQSSTECQTLVPDP